MASSNYITDKVQRAIQAFLKTKTFSAIPAERIYRGIEYDRKENTDLEPTPHTLPCVDCICQTAEVDVQGGLGWKASAVVAILTAADDNTEDEHHAQAAAVLDEITTDTIATDLSAALDDFTAYRVNFTSQGWEIAGRAYRSFITFEVICVGMDVT